MPEQRAEKILFVDDEASLVAGIVRQFRKQYNIVPAGGGHDGLNLLRTIGPFAVVVSDLRMPAMDGIQFLAKVRETSPDSVRIMLTGNADLDTAMQAVNEGQIFRFLTKPCPPGILSATLEAAIKQYRLITAERDLLQRTLRGSIKVLTDILALASPAAFGRAMRARELARQVAAELGVSDAWRIELAAMLSHIGCVTLPPETVEKIYHGKPLSPDEVQMAENHPRIGRDLIANIPRLEKIAQDVAYQQKQYNGVGPPGDDIAGDKIPLGARILKLVLDFDTLESSGEQRAEAVAHLRARDGWYDPRVLTAFEGLVSAETHERVLSLRVKDLEVGMMTARDVRSDTGVLLLARGQEISEALLERLVHFAESSVIAEPIDVTVPGHLAAAQEATAGAGAEA
jgi:response regulator RpfG family c-di-GMP phosphodiesterase